MSFVYRPFLLASLPDLPRLERQRDLLRLPDLVIAETLTPNAHSRKKKKKKGQRQWSMERNIIMIVANENKPTRIELPAVAFFNHCCFPEGY